MQPRLALTPVPSSERWCCRHELHTQFSVGSLEPAVVTWHISSSYNHPAILFLFYNFIFMCICILPECMSVCWVPWNWNHRSLLSARWVLATEPRSSKEQSVLLTTEQFLQPPPNHIILKVTPCPATSTVW